MARHANLTPERKRVNVIFKKHIQAATWHFTFIVELVSMTLLSQCLKILAVVRMIV